MPHLIFEGAELSGKSFIMSQVYDFLEEKYHSDPNRLDGCYWFNCDVGLFGSPLGKRVIKNYYRILKDLAETNVILEKFHITDRVYSRLYRRRRVGYRRLEKRLEKLDYKIIFLTFPEEKELLAKRLEDRLNLYPHYDRIAKDPEFYIKQQRLYRHYLHRSRLDCLEVEIRDFPDEKAVAAILQFIGEN